MNKYSFLDILTREIEVIDLEEKKKLKFEGIEIPMHKVEKVK